MDNAQIIAGRYAVGHKLGAGMQAEVRAARDMTTDTPVALKIIDKSNIRTKALIALEREINIMKTVSHPNVLDLKGAELDLSFEGKPSALLVLEIASGGELFDYLMFTGYFEEQIARTYMQQLVSALECCHSHNIFHRDIKPENILLDSNFQLKLADFGLSNVTDDADTVLETECGTKSYMAPEIFAHNGYYGESVDVWSSGVVLFIMLCGSPPFDIANRKDWWFNAVSMNRYDRFWAAHLRGAGHMRDKSLAQDFINRTLVPSVNDRMTIAEMKAHDWLAREGLDSRRLCAAMSERHRKVEDAKEAERAAARRKNAAQHGGAVNVFERNTHRSIGPPPPLYDPEAPGANALSQFYASDGEEDMLMRLTKVIMALDSSAQVEASPASFSVNAMVTLPGDSFEMDGEVISTPGSQVSLVANIYRTEDASSDDLLLVGLRRSSGEPFAFKKVFDSLRGSFVAAEGSDEAGLEEEEFSADIGMI